MVQPPISELSITMIEMEFTLRGDMHRNLASDQARLLFFTEDLQCQTTVRDGVISFDLPLSGSGEKTVQIQLGRQRSPGRLRITRWLGEALVVSGNKSFQKEIGLLQRSDAGEPHLLNESILKGLPEPLDAPLG